MSFFTATQAQRVALRKAVQKVEVVTRDTSNGSNLRGVRNDFTDAQANAAVQALANAIKAAGFTAV